MVLKEIQDLCRNSSYSPRVIRYMQGKADSFGGNFSTQKRISHFDHQDDGIEIPCGFLKEFPISESDRMAMENCKGVVVISAIFGDHDKIRQPIGLGSKTLENVCFFMFVDNTTLQGLNHHKLISSKSIEHQIGVWRLVKVSSNRLYNNPAMNGVIPKYLVHRLFPNSKFSIWLDAKLQLMVDPLLLIHSLVVVENVDMAISKHPYYIHTMEEAMATARWKKWGDVDLLKTQMETYCENGLQPWTPDKLPYTSDVPDSALILRKHGMGSNLFSCLLFNELEAFNPRDQLAFAFVRDHMNPKIKMSMFDVEVFEQIALEYRHNLKRAGPSSTEGPQRAQTKRASFDSFVNGGSNSSCERMSRRSTITAPTNAGETSPVSSVGENNGTVNVLQQLADLLLRQAPIAPTEGSKAKFFREFQNQDPPIFQGGPDPTIAERWLSDIKKALDIIDVPSRYRTTFASHLLRGDAEFWWQSVQHSRTVATISWDDFEKAFNGQYFRESYKDAKRREFIEFIQGDLTVAQYEARFLELSRFASSYVATEAEKTKKFLWGLKPAIQDRIVGLRLRVYTEVVNIALEVEASLEDSQRIREKKGTMGGGPRGQNSGQAQNSGQSQRQERGQQSNGFYSGGRPPIRRLDSSNNTSSSGSRQRNSPYQRIESVGRNSSGPVICFGYGKPGHIKRFCTKSGDQQSQFVHSNEHLLCESLVRGSAYLNK